MKPFAAGIAAILIPGLMLATPLEVLAQGEQATEIAPPRATDERAERAGPGSEAEPPMALAPEGASAVAIVLTGGSLQRGPDGTGQARVEARITNKAAERHLLGLRVAAYYDVIDALPASDARWQQHEFLLEPPLPPGASAALRFSDEHAAEYVLLEVSFARFSLALALDERAVVAARNELVELDGSAYLAVRDLAEACGASLHLSDDKRISLRWPPELNLPELALRPGSQTVMLGSERRELTGAVLERAGRSYLPLEGICALLGWSAEYDRPANFLRLTSPAALRDLGSDQG